ncbi:MAG: hypothetical protein VKJ64_21155, partial [Leptolyngbyaceae bacterium]|nr:hypothetical protein [Leptolyngbyaceae bacterium]
MRVRCLRWSLSILSAPSHSSRVIDVGHFPWLKSVGPNRRNVQTNRVGMGAIALLSGIAMGLTNAPTNGWPLAWVAQVPLWLLLYHHAFSRPSVSFSTLPLLHALLWAMGYYGTTLIWITGLHPLTWMGIPWVASVAIALSCWAIVTLWGCLWSVMWAMGFTTLLRWLGHQPGLFAMATRVLVGTALWCGLDTLWSQGILYWPTLALTQSPSNLWVLQLNQLSGPITTTALIVTINGLLAECCHPLLPYPAPPSGVNRPTIGTPLRFPALILALSLMAIAHLLGAWLYFRPPLPAATPGHDLAIGLIQGNIPSRIKLTRAGIQQAFDRYTQGYDQLADQGADLVVLPEGAIPLVWDGSKAGINAGGNPVAKRVGDRHI